MLNKTSASFNYGGCHITAKRTVDIATGKFFGWYGEFSDDCAIFAKSINQFEKKFIEFVDKRKAEGKPILTRDSAISGQGAVKSLIAVPLETALDPYV